MAHALLSASGAKRWLACTPSARLEAELPESTSVFAEEGRLAHELAEAYLLKALGKIKTSEFNKLLKPIYAHKLYSKDMDDYVGIYVDEVIRRLNEARAECSEDAEVFVEQRLDFSKWVPEGFGTGDAIIIAGGIIEVVDLKYGKGVPVSAEDNPQMRLYGLGAYDEYDCLYDIQTVRTTIVQPRLDSISTEELSASDLVKWAEDEVKPRADLAFEGKGEFCAGDHCGFCKIKATCRARAEANLALEVYVDRSGPELTIDEIGEILFKLDEFKKWAEELKKYSLDQAENHGIRFPGWKLVTGKSNRTYVDAEKVAAALLNAEYSEDIIYEKSLLGITALEKAIGKSKFKELLEDAQEKLIIKPTGKPTLVPESDSRPELNSLASAEAAFEYYDQTN